MGVPTRELAELLQERIERLEAHRQELQNELDGVDEAIRELAETE